MGRESNDQESPGAIYRDVAEGPPAFGREGNVALLHFKELLVGLLSPTRDLTWDDVDFEWVDDLEEEE